MIFITVGSQKFQFNRLLREIDKLIEEKKDSDSFFAQIGFSDYLPKHYEYEKFMSRSVFSEKIKRSEIVITHGGSGAIIGALKERKKVIAVPRLAKYGEHVDNHQIELVTTFKEKGLITVCTEMNDLPKKIDEAREKPTLDFMSNNEHFCEILDHYIERCIS